MDGLQLYNEAAITYGLGLTKLMRDGPGWDDLTMSAYEAEAERELMFALHANAAHAFNQAAECGFEIAQRGSVAQQDDILEYCTVLLIQAGNHCTSILCRDPSHTKVHDTPRRRRQHHHRNNNRNRNRNQQQPTHAPR